MKPGDPVEFEYFGKTAAGHIDRLLPEGHAAWVDGFDSKDRPIRVVRMLTDLKVVEEWRG